ncbi:peptidylprolyl isomerase [Microbacterium sp. cf332]|uniref:peptidylprolyl isomerase n=1 Tax=Microbacterium sp. cf332 TaxID=1761804 RepID=UPI000881F399|nr:peptidylprolyl isomerase [Microbacterium sp. cf332]SDQ57695.1 peptidyl-prolyl cis-trans isomerase B (cyclophilin B) [Microbacterium sp. cf332]
MRARLGSTLLVLSVLALAGCSSSAAPDAADTMPTADSVPEGACAYVEAAGGVRDATAPPAEAEVSGEVAAVLQTSVGDIPMTLDADRTPCTVGSFVSLAEQGYYDDSPCHRLTTSGIFVLQCGDPSGTGRGGPGYRYGDELDGSETYPAGTVAMANAGADTNGSQFFLVYEDTPLPPSYTVFGQLDEAGLAVVREVAAAGAEGGAPDGAPATAVTITGISLG